MSYSVPYHLGEQRGELQCPISFGRTEEEVTVSHIIWENRVMRTVSHIISENRGGSYSVP